MADEGQGTQEQQQEPQGITLAEIEEFLADNWSHAASAVTDFVAHYATHGFQNAAEFSERMSTLYANEFLYSSSRATMNAEAAAATGNSVISDYYRQLAAQYQETANYARTMATEEFSNMQSAQLGARLTPYVPVVATALELGEMAHLAAEGKWDELGKVSTGIFYTSLALGILETAGVLAGMTFGAGLLLIGLVGLAAGWIGHKVWDAIGGVITDEVSDLFELASNWIQRRDPLTFDLDGDGIESIGLNSNHPVLFDHDGDGIRTGTGWISADDGFLVYDRNGNGTIDSGRELFGDSTLLPDGTKAADGFAALAAEDTNHDGLVSADDANFAQLRMWRDLNQDGISQANELFTLQELGIAAINVASVQRDHTLGNGNQIADVGTFVRTDGTEGTVGEVQQTADVNLAESSFRRQFPDQIPLVPEAERLPDMGGSGKVRDLSEAASLSPDLLAVLGQFAAAQTRSEQLALIDSVLLAWAHTSGMLSMEQRADAIDRRFGWWRIGAMTYPGSGTAWASSGGGGGGTATMPADFPDPDQWEQRRDEWNALVTKTENMFAVLEAFNGHYFFSMPEDNFQGARSGLSMVAVSSSGGGGGGVATFPDGPPGITIGILEPQLALLQESYDALRQSVYRGLALQTRLREFTGLITLVPDAESGKVTVSFAAQEAEFARRIQANAADGMADLMDYTRGMSRGLAGTDWKGWELVESYLRGLPVTPDLQAIYDQAGVKFATEPNVWLNAGDHGSVILGLATNDAIAGGNGQDALLGGDGNDTLSGGMSADSLLGQAGADSLRGDAGADVLIGGTGNDWLQGGAGDDTYVFGAGDGQDQIDNYDTGVGRNDVLNFKPSVSTADVVLATDGSSLIITFRNSTDRVVVQNFFASDNYALNAINFSDGTTWDLATIKAKVVIGTAGDDTLTVHESGGTIYGRDGNDTLIGSANADRLEGESGNDTMDAGDGDDVIYDPWGANIARGGAGNDTINAMGTIEGGTGNDTLSGTGNATVYVYNAGDGLDTITDYGYASAPYQDTLQFGAGITPASISLARTGNDLIFRISDTDQITVKNWFADVYYYGIERFTFADGTVWDQAALQSLVPAPFAGTDAGETINGWDGIDLIDGGAGNDAISGAGGNDVLQGSGGNDALRGGDGNDQLLGGDGNDNLQGDNGDDVIEGGDGDDTVYDVWGANVVRGGAGNDTINAMGTIEGGTGNDALSGTGNSTTYIFNAGDGLDTITDYGYGTAPYADTLQLGAGITPAQVSLVRSGNDLTFRISDTDQITVKNWFADVYYYALERVTFADGTVWDQAFMQTLAPQAYSGTAGADNIGGWDGIDLIDGGDGDDVISGAGANDQLQGSGGNDTLRGGDGNDHLLGGDGNDTLQGDNGDDFIEGGAGDDTVYDPWGANVVRGGAGNDNINAMGTIEGGTGNDTLIGTGSSTSYIFNLGDGIDTISDYGYGTAPYADTLQLGAGILPSQISLIRNGNDLTFRISDTDQITVKNWFADVYYNAIENVTFADGTAWTMATMQALLPQQYVATAGADSINGWDGIDLIDGGDGNDTINGYGGNDVLLGGAGDDAMKGGDGNDQLAGGDGNDNLQGENGDDTIDGGTGDDTIYDVWGANVVRGGAGNDTINAMGSIEGGAGNDTLTGTGNSTLYIYNLGDGADRINDYGYGTAQYADTLRLGAGITAASVTMIRTGNDLTFRFNVTDQVTVSNWFADVYYNAIENVTFADGTSWDLATMQNLTGQQFVGTSGNDTINGWNGVDLIDGGDGNDTINGLGGNDTLSGSGGDDALRGGDGNDLLLGGDGNDNLQGENGDDTLEGGAGNDTIYDVWGANVSRGGAGNDNINAMGTIEGGTGNDTLTGTGNSTIYVYNAGDGLDTISDYGYGTATYADTLKFGAGILPSQISLVRSGNDLTFRISDTDQVTVKNWFADVYYNAIENVTFADGTAWTMATMQALLPQQYVGTTGADTINGWDGIDLIDGGDGNDTINGAGGNDVLQGSGGNDAIHGGDGNDLLVGGDGNDNLQGDNGDDTIDGGTGDDTVYDVWGANVVRGGVGNDNINAMGTIEGGTGNDTLTGTGNSTIYVFNAGDGFDTISDYGYGTATYADTLKFGAGILPSQISLVRSGNDLTFRISDTDQVTVKNWFADVYYNAIENVTFADGTAWTMATMQALLPQQYVGTTGADTINGWDGIDLIDGSDGNDTINGYGANDVLLGGAGNDAIRGGDGNDQLIGGDGNDNLQGENGDDTIEGGTGDDTIYDVWGANVVRGGAGNDNINAMGTIEGGIGNDTLTGSGNSTTYVFNAGDGLDTITDYGYGTAQYADTLQFGAGITPAQISLVRSGNDLTFRISDTDQVTVKNWFADSWYYAMERVTFADGTVWSTANMQALVPQQYVATAAADTLNGWDGIDLVDGGDGNDTINGYGANDVLLGGAGNDAIKGGDGNDQLIGGEGNDNLQGENGDDLIEGGAGDDTIYDVWGANVVRGGDGNDNINAMGTIEGGTGNDTLTGTGNSTTYVFNAGDGLDTITDYGYGTAQYADTLRFGAGILPAQVSLVRSGNDLTFRVSDTDQVTVKNWFADSWYYAMENVTFADGAVWTTANLQALVPQQFVATAAADSINGWDGIDLIDGGDGNDTINGYGANDVLQGGAGNDAIKGGDGNDQLIGGDGNDNLQGENGDDLIDGGTGDDTIYDVWGANVSRGGAGNDNINAMGTIEGGTGNDTLTGTGNSTIYVYNAGDGLDTISDYGYGTAQYADTLQFGAGIAASQITLVRGGNDLTFRMSDTDQVTVKNWMSDPWYNGVENVTFSDGTVWTMANIQAQVPQLYTATTAAETLYGWDGVDVIDGSQGNDIIYGREGADLLIGGEGNDTLYGENGNDMLQGGAGDDQLNDTAGNGVFDGGAGVDTLTSGSGRGFFAGGAGNDTINTGTGVDLIAFNRGNGADVVAASTGADNTLSLGGGIAYADLSLRRSGNDLVLDAGAGDQVTFQGWYASTQNRSVLNLQVVAEAMAGFAAGGSDPLLDQKVEQFNFAGLVGRFDQLLAANPGLTSWAVMGALLEFQTGGSDSAALGGDLAYQYGLNGSLTGIGYGAAQGAVNDTNFGVAPQNLNSTTGVYSGVARLG